MIGLKKIKVSSKQEKELLSSKSAFPFEDTLHINGPSEYLFTEFCNFRSLITSLKDLSHTGFTNASFEFFSVM